MMINTGKGAGATGVLVVYKIRKTEWKTAMEKKEKEVYSTSRNTTISHALWITSKKHMKVTVFRGKIFEEQKS